MNFGAVSLILFGAGLGISLVACVCYYFYKCVQRREMPQRRNAIVSESKSDIESESESENISGEVDVSFRHFSFLLIEG
jgi:hypothetical protein